MSVPPLVYHTVQFDGKQKQNKKTCSTSPRNKVGKIAISYKLQETGRRGVVWFPDLYIPLKKRSRSRQFALMCERGGGGFYRVRHSLTSQALLTHTWNRLTFTTMAPLPLPPCLLAPKKKGRTILRTNCPHGVTEVEQLYQKDSAVGSGEFSDPSVLRKCVYQGVGHEKCSNYSILWCRVCIFCIMGNEWSLSHTFNLFKVIAVKIESNGMGLQLLNMGQSTDSLHIELSLILI